MHANLTDGLPDRTWRNITTLAMEILWDLFKGLVMLTNYLPVSLIDKSKMRPRPTLHLTGMSEPFHWGRDFTLISRMTIRELMSAFEPLQRKC
jgi:hypothetical protein